MKKKLFLYYILLFSCISAIAQKHPVAVNDSVVVPQNSSYNPIAVTLNDSVYNGSVLSVSVIDSPMHGTASVINNNQVNYIPKPYYYGTDFFTYSACDSINLCDTATVFILVSGVDYPPVAGADTFTLNDSTNTIFLPVTANDTDPEGFSFTITSVISPDTLLGFVSLDSSGQVLFIRKPLSCGTSSFQYVICDALNACDTGTALLMIDCPDDVFKPQGFSPNGDGINDNLVFTNLEYFSPASLKVFNRWGNTVYDNDDYRNDWNGTNRASNEALPDGTYYYVLELTNHHKYTSYLVINR